MNLSREEILDASKEAGIPLAQAESLLRILSFNEKQTLFPNLLFYLGSLLLLSSLIYLGFEGHRIYGSQGLLGISLGSFLVLFTIGIFLWRTPLKKTWGGWVLCMSLCCIPVILFSWTNLLDWRTDPLRWIMIESVTLIMTLVTFYFVRFPPILGLLYLSAWLLITKTSSLFIKHSFEETSILFGILGTLLTLKTLKKDFVFWGYFISSLAFWVGATFTHHTTEWEHFGYFAMNVALIIVGSFLKQIVFFCLGSIGIVSYLLMLSYRQFLNSPLFFLILIVAGLVTMGLGVGLQRSWKK